MDYQKENFKTLKAVSKTKQSQNFDWDIIVPDSKPDVGNIISTEGTIFITNKEIMQDRAIINGNVKINILYIPSEEVKTVKSIESVQNFNCVLELQDLRQNMILDLYTFMPKISSNIINSRKISVSSLIEFLGTAFDYEEVYYIDKVEDEKIHCQKKDIKTLKMISCFEKTLPFNENIEVPAGNASIVEILKIKPSLLSKEIKNTNNKFILRGNLGFTTVYLCNSDTDFIQHMTHEISVNEVLDCENMTETSIFDYDIEINNFNYILKDNSDDEKRIIKVCGDIIIKGKIYEEIFFAPITDLYSLEEDLKLDKCKFQYEEILNNLTGHFSVKDTASFNDVKDIQKILMIDIGTEVKNISNNNGILKLNGLIVVNMLYLSMGGKVCFSKNNLPFENNINIADAVNDVLYDLKLETDSFSYNIISSHEIELRVNISYKLRIKNILSQEIVGGIEKGDKFIKNSKRGMMVYFCEGNEDLWELAKKYRTTVDEISDVNELNDDCFINKGKKLIIP